MENAAKPSASSGFIANEPRRLMEDAIELPVNPGRVLFGLSRIGYTPESAVCDIVDNAVSARATTIRIFIKRRDEEARDTRRGNVREYLIIDDGAGMTEKGIQNALTLGASDENYDPRSLSKFGLGLKSAAFSQGDELEVISSPGDGVPFGKYRVALREIKDKYFATKQPLSADDSALIGQYLPDGHGTIVRVGEVRRVGHPSIKATLQQLRQRIGVIYYYFLRDGELSISLEGEPIPAFDVLFTAEADANGDLNENTWNGLETRWIQREKHQLLDRETTVKVYATIEVTQLPHPPSFATPEKTNGDGELRARMMIDANNYGYYVYRNKRLISWADSLDGFVPRDNDLYSFRGRILIDDTADDVFNIDVKKSHIKLSEEARESLSSLAAEYRRKSFKAWNRAKQLKKAADSTGEPNKLSNTMVAQVTQPTALPGQPLLSPKQEAEAEKQLTEQMRAGIEKQIDQTLEQLQTDNPTDGEDATPLTDEEKFEKVLKGDNDPFTKKIFRVPVIPGDLLWEPYYDATHEHCVRINRYHRFAKVLFEDNDRNPDLQVIFEVFMHQMAVAEVQFRMQFQELFPKLALSPEKVESLTSKFRQYISSQLAFMCDRLDDKLPRSQ